MSENQLQETQQVSHQENQPAGDPAPYVERMDLDHLAGVLEALIFVSGDPVPAKRLADVLEVEEEYVKEGVEELSERLLQSGSGIQVMEVAGGYQLRTRPTHSEYVNRYLERKRKVTLSGPALETLAIIAYKQPITRAEIEAIRGVGVDGVLKSLLDKRLVKLAGVKEAPGRPNMYGTSKHFLEYFGLKSLKDLPPIEYLAETFSSGASTEMDEGKEEREEAVAETPESSKTTGAEPSQEIIAESQQDIGEEPQRSDAGRNAAEEES